MGTTRKTSRAEVIARLQEMQKHGWPERSGRALATAMGMSDSTIRAFIRDSVPIHDPPIDAKNPATWTMPAGKAYEPPPVVERSDPTIPDRLLGILKKRSANIEDLAEALSISPGQALDGCYALKNAGKNIGKEGDTWFAHDTPIPAFAGGEKQFEILSDERNRFRFGVVADSHLGSKYERLDCLNDIYDRFQREGITHVYHCGNWIEGEARFNKTDIAIHGMDAQLEYLAKNYPQRPGIITFAVTGDDHEGWYAQREGCDIGKSAQNAMREAGRQDWFNLGYMEAHVLMRNANSGKTAPLAIVHPGGGSAYAESYVVQKIIESLEGGEKPAMAMYGHYHKALAGEYRNVFWALVPSTKDQDVFMRKKRLRSVVGGLLVEVDQYPEDGALHSYRPWIWRYFNRAYYTNGRWSPSGSVVLPDRAAA